MRYAISTVGLFLLLLAAFGSARADDVLLLVEEPPADGLVVARVDLTGAVRWGKIGAVAPGGIRAFAGKDEQPIPFQFVPDVDYHPQERVAGTVVLQLPEGSDGRLRLFHLILC